MPRYIFSPSNVTTGGRQARVTFYRSATDPRRVTDLWRVDENDVIDEPISNGIIVTESDGDVGDFAGPDDLSTLYISVNEGSRSSVSAVRSSTAEAAAGAGTPLILIDDPESLPPGTAVGTVVVVRNP